VTKAICAVTPFLPILRLQVLAPIGVVDLHPAEVAIGIFHPPRA
jgi:hypothetical protein